MQVPWSSAPARVWRIVERKGRKSMSAGAQPGSINRRAESLAKRIEEGANGLAEFAAGLSEAEWRTPLSRDGSDRRSIGVIVHHVASVYPIEVDLARAIGSGTPVTEVTWEAVADLNAGHFRDNGGVSKADAIEL